MKTWGWVLLVFGSLSFFGALIGGKASPMGGMFFAALGAYLIHHANQKKEENRKKKDWENMD